MNSEAYNSDSDTIQEQNIQQSGPSSPYSFLID